MAVVRLRHRRRHRHLRMAHATFHLPVHSCRRHRLRLAKTPRFQSAAPKNGRKIRGESAKIAGKTRSEPGQNRRMVGTGNPSLWCAPPPCELEGTEAIGIRSSSKARWARPRGRRGEGGQCGNGERRGELKCIYKIIKLFLWNMPRERKSGGIFCKISLPKPLYLWYFNTE